MTRARGIALAGMLAGGLLGAEGVSSPLPASTEDAIQVVVEANRVAPRVLTTTAGQRITFVNRTGRAVHLEFYPTSHGHRVFQVPGHIWVLFDVPGRHRYVVHVGEGERLTALEGTVEVREERGGERIPLCNGVIVGSEPEEVCVER